MNNQSQTTWWNRSCGGRDVLSLALPLIVSTASWTVMNFVDRMFLLWHDQVEMAATMPAGLLHFTLLCFPLGVATYANTFVAQYHGAGRPQRIGLAVWQGVWVGMAVLPLFIVTSPLVAKLFAFSGHEAQLAHLEGTYYQIVAWCAGAVVMSGALSSFFTGRGQTRVVMVVDVFATVLNLVLDYLWIFGHFGLPEMGIEGAAWASVVSQWAKVLIYWRLMMLPQYRDCYGVVVGRRFDLALMRRLLRFGGPNGLQMFAEVAAFSVFILLVGQLGEQAMAATTLAFNVNMLAFLPMLGLGIAVSTMVGQQLGQNRPDLAARATWTGFSMTQAYMVTMALAYVLVPDIFLMGHAAGTSVDFTELRDTTIVLLRFVAAYSLLDAMNVIFCSALKGAGDTRFILFTASTVSIPPVAAAWIGMHYFGAGLIWCWSMLTIYVCVLALSYFARYLHGKWQHMRVIEPDVVVDNNDVSGNDSEITPAVVGSEEG